MAGSITSDQRCEICGSGFVDTGRALACPNHKYQHATRLRVGLRSNGELVQARLTDHQEANRFLNGIRFKIDEGSFDARDYRSDNPLGFANLTDNWLDIKKSQIKPKSWNNLNNYMRIAINTWGNRNVKEIGYAEIEDFLFKDLSGHSSKSRANARSTIHSFFDWLRRHRVLSQTPEIPEVAYELEFPKTIDRATQDSILAELERITAGVNPRIWIAIKWLATYISIRSGELIRTKEGEIERDNGFLIIPHPKEKKPKVVPLIEEDLELVRSMPRALPELPFFRHLHGVGGSKPGEQFGPRYLWKWWKKACDNLGIKGVDLYGGTKHSTVIALGEQFAPEELRQASMHSTNKAFERYYRVKPEVVRSVYCATRGGHQMDTGKRPIPISKPK